MDLGDEAVEKSALTVQSFLRLLKVSQFLEKYGIVDFFEALSIMYLLLI